MSPTTAEPGTGAENEWVCIVLDSDIFTFECEEESEVVTCWATEETVGCDPESVDCEAYFFSLLGEDDSSIYVRCGDPLYLECVWTSGELNCEGLPPIDTDSPNAHASTASFPSASCSGIWGSQTRNSAGAGQGGDVDQLIRGAAGNYDSHDDFGAMEVVETGEAEAYTAESLTRGLIHQGSFLVPTPTAPGVVGNTPGEAGKAGIIVSLLLFGIDAFMETSPDVNFPTRSWYVVCGGSVEMGGECRGGVFVEERQCVLVIVDPLSGAKEDIPGTHCNFRYLPEFPLTCWSSFSGAAAQPNGSGRETGTFSNSNRNLPSEAKVCWDKPVSILNRPYNDYYGVLVTAEDAIGYNPEDNFAQNLVGDCRTANVDWDELTWTTESMSCGNVSQVCTWTGYVHTYDPNTGAYGKEQYCRSYAGSCSP